MCNQSTIVVTGCKDRAAHARSKVGGKALNLFRLQAAGFRVAPFVVITADAFSEHTGKHREEILTLLDSIDIRNQASIAHASLTVRQIIARQPFPPQILDTITRTSRSQFEPTARLAVRSSVADEDSVDSSFAGMMDSYLNVVPARLISCIVKVWQSAYSERALAYRLRRKQSTEDIAVAVVVQQFIDTPVSGVMFTSSPNGNGSAFTIAAGYGLGEGIVSGLVETDTYRLTEDRADITSKIGLKRSCIQISPNGTGGTRIVRVPSEMADKPVLSESNLFELRKVGANIHRTYQCAQDIEWGYDNNGRLFIMQARPVTTGPTAGASPKAYIWDNANIVESYPGLTLPLTFSFIVRNYAVLFRKAACGLTLRKRELHNRTDIWNNMLGLLRGRVYYNLANWYAMLSYLPGFRRFQRTWDQMIGITKATPCAPHALSVVDRIYTVTKTTWYLLTTRGTARRFLSRCDQALAPYRDRDFSNDGESEVLSAYQALENDLLDFWHVTLYSDLCAMVYYDILKHITKKWCKPDYHGLHHELLRKSHDMESVKPLRSLMRIAQLVRDSGRFREFFSLTDEEAWNTIQTSPNCAPIRDAINAHLSAYGDRCFDELKLESNTYRDDPAALMHLIRTYANYDTLDHGLSDFSHEVKNDVTGFPEAVSNPVKRLVIRVLACQARRAITNRENMRFARTRAYGVVRRMFRSLGRLMAQRSLIAHQEDIFYLSVEEVFGANLGTGVTFDLRALVAQRKNEYAEYASQELPVRFTSGYYPLYEEHTSKHCASSCQNQLVGTGCSAGVATGRARMVTDPRSVDDCRGCVLVTRTTDPSWVFLMLSANAIVAERGSVLSHTAIVGRELGIPTVVGVKDASRMIPNNAVVTVEGSSGRVTWK